MVGIKAGGPRNESLCASVPSRRRLALVLVFAIALALIAGKCGGIRGLSLPVDLILRYSPRSPASLFLGSPPDMSHLSHRSLL